MIKKDCSKCYVTTEKRDWRGLPLAILGLLVFVTPIYGMWLDVTEYRHIIMSLPITTHIMVLSGFILFVIGGLVMFLFGVILLTPEKVKLKVKQVKKK